MDVVILHGLFQVLFHEKLYPRVHRCHHVEAVLARLIVLKAGKQQLGSEGIGRAHRASGRTGERLVVTRFDPLEAVVVRPHKADEMAGQGGVWIIALGIGLETHTAQVVFLFEAADLIGLLLLHLPRHGYIPGTGLPGFLADFRFVQP